MLNGAPPKHDDMQAVAFVPEMSHFVVLRGRIFMDQLWKRICKGIDIIHQRCGYLGEWANADKIDLLILLLIFRIVRRKVKLLEIDALDNRTELTSI
jgi:hypothetical protein